MADLPSIDELCSGVPENVRALVAELAENAYFMRGKLMETRREMEDADVTVEYDNGGGQRGTRENPIFKGYHALLTSYRKTVEQLVDILGRYGAGAEADGGSPLDKILAEAEAVLADAR